MASLKIGVLGKMGFFGKGGPLVKMEDFVDFGNLLGTFGAKWRQNPCFPSTRGRPYWDAWYFETGYQPIRMPVSRDSGIVRSKFS